MIKLRVDRDWTRRDGFNVWLMEYRSERTHVAQPFALEFKELPEYSLLPEPSLRLAGDFGRELVDEARKALAGLELFSKEELAVHAKVEKAMQAHIDSLRLVVERTVKP